MAVVAHSPTSVALRLLPEPLVVTVPDGKIEHHCEDERRQTEKCLLSKGSKPLSVHETVFPSIRPRTDSHTGCKVPATISSTQTALIITQDRSYRLESEFPTPQDLGAGEVIIRNRAVGLNHIDWKSVEYNFCLPELPWITGREMAGVVERIGSGVTKFKTGDAVWTCK